METKDIKQIIDSNPVTLFMKGTPDFPMCGFSNTVVSILKKINVDFHAVNVLEDDTIRQGIKDFSDWPTIPQLYVAGTFVGGCDIVVEMAQANELQELLTKKSISYNS